MAQTTRNTNGMAGINVTALKNAIAAARSAIATNNIIHAADLNAIVSLWNTFNSHYHTTSDLYGIHDYGNTDPPGYGGGQYQTDNSGTLASYGSNNLNSYSVGNVITASDHNNLSSGINQANNHTHTIPDRTS